MERREGWKREKRRSGMKEERRNKKVKWKEVEMVVSHV